MKRTGSILAVRCPVILGSLLCCLAASAFAQIITSPPLVLPEVSLRATITNASVAGVPGRIIVTRTGPTTGLLAVFLGLGGTALNGVDYVAFPNMLLFPVGVRALELPAVPIDDLPRQKLLTW